jgi:cadmium resistance protein CadD (predicted permease)
MKKIFSNIGLWLTIVGAFGVLGSMIIQTILTILKYGFIVKDNVLFIKHWSVYGLLGIIPFTIGVAILNKKEKNMEEIKDGTN